MGNLVKKNKCFEAGVSVDNLLAEVNELREELQGKIDEVNALIAGINSALGGKVSSSGGTLTGVLNTRDLVPGSANNYNLGSATKPYSTAFLDGISFNGGENTMKFDWHSTSLSVVLDKKADRYYLPNLPNHSIFFSWDGSHFGLFIDNTFVGNLSFA